MGASFVLTSFLWGHRAVIRLIFNGGVVGECLGSRCERILRSLSAFSRRGFVGILAKILTRLVLVRFVTRSMPRLRSSTTQGLRRCLTYCTQLQ